MAYASWSVVFGEQPSAAKWNILGTNDASFNDGTGIGTNAISAASLATSAIKLGQAQITSNFTTTNVNTYIAVTSLSVTVTIPSGNRSVLILANGDLQSTALAGTQLSLAIEKDATTVIGQGTNNQPVLGYAAPFTPVGYDATPSAGSHTYQAYISQTGAGTLTLNATAATATSHGPATLLALLI